MKNVFLLNVKHKRFNKKVGNTAMISVFCHHQQPQAYSPEEPTAPTNVRSN